MVEEAIDNAHCANDGSEHHRNGDHAEGEPAGLRVDVVHSATLSVVPFDAADVEIRQFSRADPSLADIACGFDGRLEFNCHGLSVSKKMTLPIRNHRRDVCRVGRIASACAALSACV
jgi:hypothetical protein